MDLVLNAQLVMIMVFALLSLLSMAQTLCDRDYPPGGG